MKLFISLFFLFPFFVYSYSGDEKLIEAIHLSSKGKNTFEAVTQKNILESIHESIEKYRNILPVERISLYDITYPKDKKEFNKLNGNSLILLTSITHTKEEFPIKRVFVETNEGKEYTLLKLLEIGVEVNEKIVKESFGKYRSDAVYLLPLDLTKKNSLLKLDFNVNRKNFTLIDFPLEKTDLEEVVDFNSASHKRPPTNIIIELILREIPFIFHKIKNKG